MLTYEEYFKDLGRKTKGRFSVKVFSPLLSTDNLKDLIFVFTSLPASNY